MRLLIHDTLVTAPFAHPVAAGWIEPASGLTVELRADLAAAAVGPEDAALLPSPEIARLQQSHQVVPAAAVVADGQGAVVLRTPVRPDDVERTPVRLLAAGAGAEFLARATLRPFYGIEATLWPRTDADPGAAEAQAVVVDGADALRPVEAGFAEDLCRAWFILSGLPFVGHLLVAPLAAARADLEPLLTTVAAITAAASVADRRRAWRTALAKRYDLPREALVALFAHQRLALAAADRAALISLLQRGGRGAPYPAIAGLRFLDDDPPPTPAP